MALALAKNRTLTDLDVSTNDLAEAGCLAILYGLIQNSTLSCLNLHCNGMNERGALATAEMLGCNASLRTLNVASNGLGEAGAKHICEELATGRARLQSLYLSDNGLGEQGLLHVASMLNSNAMLEFLDLSHNDMGDSLSAARTLADGLAANTRLQSLKMCRNRLGDAFAHELARALHRNRTLRMLDLSGNEKITAEGILAIVRTLQDYPRMHALALQGINVPKVVTLSGFPQEVCRTPILEVAAGLHRAHREMLMAFVMGSHERVGCASPVRALGGDAMPMIAAAFFGVPFAILLP
jgi:Ran GTPase-activating protein (RanGAP) involved in mRNA processing and transport